MKCRACDYDDWDCNPVIDKFLDKFIELHGVEQYFTNANGFHKKAFVLYACPKCGTVMINADVI